MESVTPPKKRLKQYFALFAVLIVTLIIYSQVSDFDFISYDDERYVTENPDIKDLSLDGLKTIFISPTVPEENKPPLSVLSLAINYHFGELNPAGYHLTNLIIHLLNISLVFFLVKKLSRNQVLTIFVTAVFALHPSSGEAVAWVSARKELQYTFFYLVALMLSLKYWETGKFKFYLIAIPVFVLSFYSKYAATSFPLLYLALSFFFQNRKPAGRVIAESLPFFALPLYSVYMMVSGVFMSHAEIPPEEYGTPSDAALLDESITENAEQTADYAQTLITDYNSFDLLEKVFLGGYSIFKYLQKFVWPFDQQLLYPYPPLVDGALPPVYYIFTVLSIFAVLGSIYFFYKNKSVLREYVGFGFLLFLSKSVLLLHVLPIGGIVVIADRYMYLPFMGLSLVFFFLIEKLTAKLKSPRVKYGLLALYLIVVVFQLVNRLPAWKNTPAIFNDLIEKEVKSPVAYNNLGNYYHTKGNLKKAEMLFDKSLELDPDYVNSLTNRGSIYLNSGRTAKAKKDFNRVVEMYPDYKLVHYNLGVIHQQSNNHDSAIYHFERVITLNYSFYQAHNNLGIVYMNTGQFNKAAESFKKVIDINPDFTQAYINLGYVYQMGFKDYKSAFEYFKKALETEPNSPEAALAMAFNYKYRSKPGKAVEMYTYIIKNHPQLNQPFYLRGLVHLEQNEREKACADFEKAFELGNDNARQMMRHNCN